MARLTFIVKILLLTALLLNGCSKAPESPSVTPTKAPLEEENSGVSQDTENNGPADTINLPSNREPSTVETTLANRPEQTAPSEQASSSATPTQSIDAAPPISVLDISESNREGKNGILVTFSAQVNSAEDLQSYFAVHTENGDSVDGSWIVDDSLRKVWFMNTEPASRYKVTVNPGIPALNGSELFFSFFDTITTRRLQPSINFDSDGAILPLNYRSGLPVVTVNIDEVDVDFFRIGAEHISDFTDYAKRYGRKGWYAQRLSKFGTLAYSARFQLDAPKNTRVKRDLNIQSFEQLQVPGLYLAVMRKAGDYDNKEITWFSITDIGLHVRQYKNQLDIHASSLTTGKPLAGVELELIDNKNLVIANNTTTKKGLASFNGHYPNAQLLVGKTNNQYTLLNLQQPALDLSEFDLGSRPQLPNELFIYAPRDLYRPSEVAQFSALLRNHDGKLSPTSVLTGNIRNPSGSSVKSFKWQPDDLGYFQYTWSIPDSAPTGKWELVVTGVMEKPVTYKFNVEEFLPERMKLSLGKNAETTFINGAHSALKIPVLGEYLYGAPASGNKFSSLLQVSQWREPVESLKGYVFGDIKDKNFSTMEELPDIQLDKNGEATLTISSAWKNAYSPLKVNVVGSLYESGGRPVTRAHPVLMWPQDTLLGIRPHFGEANPKPGSQAVFDLVSANHLGELSAAKSVEVKLIREDRQYFWEYNQQRGWHWNYSEKEFSVTRETLSLNGTKPTTVSYPVEWGRYRLEVSNLAEGSQGKNLTSLQFFAGHNWYYDWRNAKSAAAARPDKINLALDKNAYQANDVAQLKILPPADGDVLILVESDRPLWSKKTKASTKGTVVEIPINSNWDTHNLYISALLIQPASKKLSTTPKRSLGLIHLPLDREERRLNVEIKTPDAIRPSTILNARLSLKNFTGPAEKTRVTLAAVDVGVLNITDFETPDPFDYFFGKRRYTVDAKDIYADVIAQNQAEKAKHRYGGDADLVRGGKKPQSEVRIISLFNGPVNFDEHGNADVNVDIPDFNGRLRLMALAFGGNEFGHSDTEVTVAAPIVAEIAMPRFLAAGDTSEIALDIQNLTEQTQTMQVELETEHPLQLNAKTQNITLEAKAKTTLRYTAKAIGHSGLASIVARISGNDIEDFSRNWKLGVRPAYPAVTKSIYNILRPSETFELSASLLPNALEDTLQANVTVSPTINLNINDQLKNLLRYPYGCLEQTSSRAWPLTYATPENQQRFNIDPISDERRKDMMQKGIDRILSFQRRNGSFGLWSNDSPEEHWLTVYATDFLLHAQQQGMDVPGAALNKAMARIKQYLQGSRTFVRQRWSRAPDHYAFATRAYAGFVLSKLNRAPLGALRNLYNRDMDDANSGLSQIHLGLALLKMGDKHNGNQALDKALGNFNNDYSYWGDYGSNIRDIGMSIYLLLDNNQRENQALELSIKLQQAVRERRWLSTQERISLFMAGIALEQDINSPWQAQWQLAGDPKESLHQSQAWSRNLNADKVQQGFSLNSNHDKPLYLSAMINGYGKEPPKPESNGISVIRRWYNSKGEEIIPNSVNAGDLLLGHIEIMSEKRVADALVINLLPAGLELENQNLEHAVSFKDFKIDGESIAELEKNADIKHREYRDDRFVAALDHRRHRNSHVFFMVRAVTPGNYAMPPPIVEDMYTPETRAIGESILSMKIIKK